MVFRGGHGEQEWGCKTRTVYDKVVPRSNVALGQLRRNADCETGGNQDTGQDNRLRALQEVVPCLADGPLNENRAHFAAHPEVPECKCEYPTAKQCTRSCVQRCQREHR
eukprot:1648241-Rhodomonas_salina.1